MNRFQNYTFNELVAVVTDNLTREELADYHDELIIRQELLLWWSLENIEGAIRELNAELES